MRAGVDDLVGRVWPMSHQLMFTVLQGDCPLPAISKGSKTEGYKCFFVVVVF